MSSRPIIVIALGMIGLTAATYFLVVDTNASRPTTAANEQRVKIFFKPSPKRNLREGQEMQPRW
ncbi:entry exclusion protein TrbK (plasmid) [Rhizobium leguminosarum]|uniref:Entry exclusion protein TrbK n=2 Tax=Rhizobium leguminosarum TaxID=384 RepID=A0A7M3DKN7_RHILE|nr:entry exclusion protein TrbK [Rhizobium leguminosarum]TBZ41314.1 entry exclusion protein TrbK [Rhizobium leguminosarum bv. viciae]TCA09429.1 entry exclusion protein TrbK [Rhizobium leguminosarum bv. viciae]TCA18859.1 entry exclusion protein TrbK [Rhizobium leguminosarum bv. viciae]